MTAITESLLPKMSNEKLNFYLKEVANFVGRHKYLPFHMDRHTFATTVIIQIYTKIIERKVSDHMATLKNRFLVKITSKINKYDVLFDYN
jgi:hypothetical protein